MLGNCDKIIVSSTSNHQWPQIIPDHDHKPFMTPSSSPQKANMADKQNQDPHLQQPLKCPRCDSSNTKFCYYNNYSLSQPRHFCKACKRYWTRGGTLRNVPVGGGCRKNKRFKRPSNAGDAANSAASTPPVNPNAQPRIDLSPAASNHTNNPLLYSLQNNLPVELNRFPFSSFRVSNADHNRGFDIQPQMNNLGIGFSSGLIQEAINTSSSTTPSLGNNYNNSIFFGSSTLASTSTMASLLASSFHHQKFVNGGLKDIINQAANHNNVPGLMLYNEDHGKEVKLERENRSAWNPNPNLNQNPNPIEQINSADPSLWNTTNVGSWFDPSNMGSSSVPSLI